MQQIHAAGIDIQKISKRHPLLSQLRLLCIAHATAQDNSIEFKTPDGKLLRDYSSNGTLLKELKTKRLREIQKAALAAFGVASDSDDD